MEKEEIIEKLKELKISSTNAYPKKSFIYGEIPCISCYKREIVENFYFFNSYDKKLYVLPYYEDYATKFQKDSYSESKYIIPLHMCSVLYEDKEYEEPEDSPHKEMTLRDYACIHLRVPKSSKPWLNQIILEAKNC